MLSRIPNTFVQEIEEGFFLDLGLRLFVKRDDQIHPFVSGNKWRKLKYNLLKAKEMGCSAILTFGGAYSNHIYATAAAAAEARFSSIGVVRGEEHLPLNPTLQFATAQGMELIYLDRAAYRSKNDPDFIQGIQRKYPHAYIIPEGGTNAMAIKGCEEIVMETEGNYDFWCLPVGTGGTMAGIITGLKGSSRVLGFSALKGADFLIGDIKGLLGSHNSPAYENWSVDLNYHFGGYAKIKKELISFCNHFYEKHKVPLDLIYTAKMMYGIYDLAKKGFFPEGTKVLAVHTGGLQGLNGMLQKGDIQLNYM